MKLKKDIHTSRKFNADVYLLYNHKHEPVRRYVKSEDGITYSFSRWLWDNQNPQNRLRRGEEIHHSDFDSLNDSIDNYEKMPKWKHIELHKRRNRRLALNKVRIRLGELDAFKRLRATVSTRGKRDN